ncbi:alpha,alpha-phosphotrehalase [Priestia aryabhattai]|uniref:alpha,alpha-phosphotrehalase n=1 Tax=Priestia aryabhattai TaxID=412384 RepID=UPI000B43734C|nr:alpha,alpha-phosphotrehalase [Priestia aryabhattai]MBZ6488892.1 alpha,alpha-phosphotrehalase [Priestia aryabhattai]MDH3116034.1 alpha,alpha-phosphotrehalase [Priestia aryabhattai]MDH3125073.1 alpha,alpha-phosphotrehalase [Priestia aryabhattai]MDH3134710.1 alpha,alpha-phosphotrehalase [Priestia aryabhattai]MED4154014.1 alpha,alpha-phosphotrehalase [Priestia aryabhattai]
MQEPWWKKSVVYQIYPKSFYDTTGNGVGDIAGIIEKLDYLKKLGVDVVWLTPIYKSPQRDNGYDISDYFVIQEEYGTMEDFDRLVAEAHKRDLKIIMDIVVNHTSTEHEWFQEAKKSKDNPYRDFYIWKNQKEDGSAPTNWVSKFGGSAWEHDKLTEQSYLHLFDVTQADLNWENEHVRRSVYDMMTFWFEKGVDGFRLDVINLISKDQRFLDDDGSIAPGDGRKFYTDGPRVHEYMREMNQEVFSKYDSMTVGEMSSTTVDHCIKYSHPDRHELSMTFNFHHLKVDYPNGEKWALADFDFIKLKEILSTWQTEMNKGGGWNALFWCNHDQPRVVSRYGNDELYHNKSAKMLAATIHLMQGTPYIYQGEEIGMTNPKFSSIDEYRDVESLNVYEIKRAQGMGENEILEILKHKSRDNSRTPVQWSDEPNAGFTKGKPWINPGDNYREINVEKALDDEDSIFYFYQKLIALRKQYEIITYGNYELILGEDEQIFAYIRNGADEKLLVINNFYGSETIFQLPENLTFEGYHSEILLSNYEDSSKEFKQVLLRPYESIVYHLKK